MLEDIRQGARGPMGKVLVIVISLAFGLWGVSTVVPLVFDGSAPVTVNGERITQAEISQRIVQERQAIFDQFGGQIDQSLLRDEFIRPQVVNQLIVARLISQSAAEHGFVLSDDGLNRILARQPAFQENGRFNAEVFSRMAARQGMTASQFRDQIGANEVAQQWVNGLIASEFVLSREVEIYGNYLHQSRSIDYITFEPNDFQDQLTIDDAAITAFYENHPDRFQTPEQISVQYVQLLRDQLLGDWSPTRAELEEAYDRYVSLQQNRQDQFISHILITLDGRSDEEALALAESLRARAVEEDFSDLAQTYSDDPGSANQGGALGRFDASVFLPEFNSIMASLREPGDISDVFSTAFGYHIVKLDTVTSVAIEDFAELQDDLTDQLAERYLSTRLPIIREELEALAFSSLDLQDIRDAFAVEIQQSPWFDRSGVQWSLANREIAQTAFSPEVLDDGLNSSVLLLDDGSLMVLRRDRFEPASIQPISQVTDEIRNLLLLEAASEAAEASARSLFNTLTETPQLVEDWQTLTALRRFDDSLPESVIDAVFQVRAPDSATDPMPFIASSSDGLWVVGRVQEVVMGEPLTDEADLILTFLRNEFSTDGIDGLINHLQSVANIRIR